MASAGTISVPSLSTGLRCEVPERLRSFVINGSIRAEAGSSVPSFSTGLTVGGRKGSGTFVFTGSDCGTGTGSGSFVINRLWCETRNGLRSFVINLAEDRSKAENSSSLSYPYGLGLPGGTDTFTSDTGGFEPRLNSEGCVIGVPQLLQNVDFNGTRFPHRVQKGA